MNSIQSMYSVEIGRERERERGTLRGGVDREMEGRGGEEKVEKALGVLGRKQRRGEEKRVGVDHKAGDE